MKEYCFGIYVFTDTKTSRIVYIGMDSHIDKLIRIKNHYQPCFRDAQPFNKVLQNNPDRYKSSVYCRVDNFEDMCQLEYDLINLYRPKFNYRIGKDGCTINRKSKYTVAKNGKVGNTQMYFIYDKNYGNLKRSSDKLFLEDLCCKLNNGELTEEEVKQIKRPLKRNNHQKINQSKSRNNSGFFRVTKHYEGKNSSKYRWRYSYLDDEGNQKSFYRNDFFKLKKEVEKRKMVWNIVDLDKAINTIRSMCTGF